MKCIKCNCEIMHNDRDPAIHYSIPDKLCFHCRYKETTGKDFGDIKVRK